MCARALHTDRRMCCVYHSHQTETTNCHSCSPLTHALHHLLHNLFFVLCVRRSAARCLVDRPRLFTEPHVFKHQTPPVAHTTPRASCAQYAADILATIVHIYYRMYSPHRQAPEHNKNYAHPSARGTQVCSVSVLAQTASDTPRAWPCNTHDAGCVYGCVCAQR